MQYPLGEHEREQIASKTGKKLDAVSYTHLTLPTKLEV